jgi:hypothetical protein
VVVMPSQLEGFGLVATEAIEQGIPVMVASTSGVGQFLTNLSGYGDAAKHFNLVEQPFGAKPSVDIWGQRVDVILDHLPAAWANARLLQNRLSAFTWKSSAQHLVAAARDAPDPPARVHDWPVQGRPARARVKVLYGQVVVYPNGDEEGDHDLILAVADAMETDRAVREAIFDDSRRVVVRRAEPMNDFYTSAIEAVFGRRELSAFVTEPIPAAVVSAALSGESEARRQLDAMVRRGIREATCQVVDESVADQLVDAAIDQTVLPHELDSGEDALPAVLAAYRDSMREELLNHLIAEPEVLHSGTVDELGEWLRRRWDIELAGFGNANPADARQLVWALNHMLRTHPQIVVRKGLAITVGEVANGNGVDMVARRDSSGRLVIESITVDPRCLFGAVPADYRLYPRTIAAFGGALLEAGGIGHAVYRYLL